MEEENEKTNEILGKFESVDALARAYAELQAEFTRRSQKLKELEKRNKEKEEPAPVPGAEGQPSAPSQEADRERFLRSALHDEEVRSRIVGEYLSSLKGVPLMTGSGRGISAPADRPKSLAEAGSLALGYFKSKN